MSETVEFVGGPLDGMRAPNNPTYFKEGDTEAVDTFDLQDPAKGWSAESVYRFRRGQLIYDAEATERRRVIVARGQS